MNFGLQEFLPKVLCRLWTIWYYAYEGYLAAAVVNLTTAI